MRWWWKLGLEPPWNDSSLSSSSRGGSKRQWRGELRRLLLVWAKPWPPLIAAVRKADFYGPRCLGHACEIELIWGASSSRETDGDKWFRSAGERLPGHYYGFEGLGAGHKTLMASWVDQQDNLRVKPYCKSAIWRPSSIRKSFSSSHLTSLYKLLFLSSPSPL